MGKNEVHVPQEGKYIEVAHVLLNHSSYTTACFLGCGRSGRSRYTTCEEYGAAEEQGCVEPCLESRIEWSGGY